jgi:hypothetical protein
MPCAGGGRRVRSRTRRWGPPLACHTGARSILLARRPSAGDRRPPLLTPLGRRGCPLGAPGAAALRQPSFQSALTQTSLFWSDTKQGLYNLRAVRTIGNEAASAGRTAVLRKRNGHPRRGAGVIRAAPTPGSAFHSDVRYGKTGPKGLIPGLAGAVTPGWAMGSPRRPRGAGRAARGEREGLRRPPARYGVRARRESRRRSGAAAAVSDRARLP